MKRNIDSISGSSLLPVHGADKIPDALVCRLTGRIFEHPVVVPESGQVYSREAIERWFEACKLEGRKLTCPVTGVRLSSDALKAKNSLLVDGVEYDSTSVSVLSVWLAANEGMPTAQLRLADRFDEGDGLPQRGREAAYWYWRAGKQRNSDGLLNLAYCFDKGRGVSKSVGKAASCYLKAAQLGNIEAQVNIGVGYFKGIGISQDDKEAVSWFRKAAEKGDTVAQHNLGLCYYSGRGDAQDLILAEQWFTRTARQGTRPAAKLLKRLWPHESCANDHP